MSFVKRPKPTLYDTTHRLDDFEPKHIGFLLDRVSRHSRMEIQRAAQRRGFPDRYAPLTPVYFRLLSLIPRGGARVTDVARIAGMTKQALGQFVRLLEDEGYVETAVSPDDKRVRIVSRTAKGDEVVVVTNQLMADVAKAWKRQLGAERWESFRDALIELATGWDPAEAPLPE